MSESVNLEKKDTRYGVPDLCKAACALGKKLKVPVYQFLKEPLIRKFGVEFYNALHEIATHHFQEQK